MAVKLPNHVSKEIKNRIFSKADDIGYSSCSRIESGAFLNALAEDENIGGVLRQYMSAASVRTYIKDGVLNAYAKAKIKQRLDGISPEDTIRSVFGVEASLVATKKETRILRSANKDVFLITTGTFLKWETALRKQLECIVSTPSIKEATSINLCLIIVVSNGEMSFGDQKQVEDALAYVGVKVRFLN